MMGSPDTFWSEVLSEEPARIRAALGLLGDAERQAALAHLKRMAEEGGWSEGQSRRARAALDIASAGLATPGHPPA